MAEASAKRVTGDEPQGTMGRVQTAVHCLLPAFLCAHIFIKRETCGYEAGPSPIWYNLKLLHFKIVKEVLALHDCRKASASVLF